MYVVGELVSKLVVSLLLLSVHGSHKSEDFTKCIICGNTRAFNRYYVRTPTYCVLLGIWLRGRKLERKRGKEMVGQRLCRR